MKHFLRDWYLPWGWERGLGLRMVFVLCERGEGQGQNGWDSKRHSKNITILTLSNLCKSMKFWEFLFLLILWVIVGLCFVSRCLFIWCFFFLWLFICCFSSHGLTSMMFYLGLAMVRRCVWCFSSDGGWTMCMMLQVVSWNGAQCWHQLNLLHWIIPLLDMHRHSHSHRHRHQSESLVENCPWLDSTICQHSGKN